tara:strand:- start:187 stop:693 length:507 start_codon:yes stop_codon:yes gene_type:complete
MEDTLRVLGYLTLGSRLKRLGERLQSDTQTLLTAGQIEVPVAQLPVLAVLDRLGPLNIGDIALSLGVAQPGITRTVTKLEAYGFLKSEQDDTDKRIRVVHLTGKGQRMVDEAKNNLWPDIETAVRQACSALEGSLLEQLSMLENALDSASIARRVAVLQGEKADDVTI